MLAQARSAGAPEEGDSLGQEPLEAVAPVSRS